MKVQRNILIILSVMGLIGVLIVNSLAVTLPINNKTTGELSDNLPNLFVPAGLTFSIWGIIYMLLIVFTVYQAVPLFRKGDESLPGLMRIRLLFVFSCLANISWIFAWHYEQIFLSVLIMLLFLGILIAIYRALHVSRKKIKYNRLQYLCVVVPFSVYLGWISVATIANMTALLVSIKWNGFGIPDYIWTIVMIGATFALGLLMLFRERDITYNLVLIWALAGIIIKRTNTAYPPQPAIVMAAIVSLVCLAAGIVVMLIKNRRKA